ncbi:hypothetical protein AB1Y20_003268 [Prymnesium parvum]|uniref:WDR59/RTC1-like RING zinc finger domain-containing protein n=1 Tax=Prymnesium parvum TaxID=97485 RepID=A0AB34JB39_PRYPA
MLEEAAAAASATACATVGSGSSSTGDAAKATSSPARREEEAGTTFRAAVDEAQKIWAGRAAADTPFIRVTEVLPSTQQLRLDCVLQLREKSLQEHDEIGVTEEDAPACSASIWLHLSAFRAPRITLCEDEAILVSRRASRREGEGFSSSSDGEGISSAHEDESISSRREGEDISPHREAEGISSRRHEGISSSGEGIFSHRDGISSHDDGADVSSRGDGEGISFRHEGEGTSSHGEDEGVSPREGEGISAREGEGTSSRREGEGISSRRVGEETSSHGEGEVERTARSDDGLVAGKPSTSAATRMSDEHIMLLMVEMNEALDWLADGGILPPFTIPSSGMRALLAVHNEAVRAVCAALQALLVGCQRAQALVRMSAWRGYTPALAANTAPDASSSAAAARFHHGSGKPIPSLYSANFEKSCVPAPRTAGAVFGGCGMLVYFRSSPSPYLGLSGTEMPRTYVEFQSLVQGWQLARIVQSVMGDGLNASLWNESGDDLDDSDDCSDNDSRGSSESGADEAFEANVLPRLRLRVRTLSSAAHFEPRREKERSHTHDGVGLLRIGSQSSFESMPDEPSDVRAHGEPPSVVKVFDSPVSTSRRGSSGVRNSRLTAARSRDGSRRLRDPSVLAQACGRRTHVALIDAAAAFEIDPRLAARCVVAPREGARPASARCLFNAQLAAEVGRTDLWRVWMLASCALSAAEVDGGALLDTSFSLMAPLFQAVFQDRLRQRDVQTVALLAAIAASQYNTLPLSPEAAVGCMACVQVYGDLLHRWGLMMQSAELLKYAPSHAEERLEESLLPGILTVQYICPAPQPTKQYTVSAPQSPQAMRRMDPQASSPSLGGSGCWYVGGASNAASSTALHVTGGLCNSSSGSLASRHAEPLTEAVHPQCAVCQLRVRGLAWFCSGCGHGGHMQCVTRWMLLRPGEPSDGFCPTGCGCCCRDAPQAAPIDASLYEVKDNSPPSSPKPQSHPGQPGASTKSPERPFTRASAMGNSSVTHRHKRTPSKTRITQLFL